MAVNTLEFIALAMTALDKQIVAESTTGWMEPNADQVIYHGGREVKIPIIDMDGLADYTREEGFTKGGVVLKYQTKEMGQDRGRTFTLDSMDVDEANFVANASAVMSEFQRKHVIPEIDAYRYSKIFELANAKNRVNAGNAHTAKTIFSALKEDIASIQDTAGDIPLIVSLPWTVMTMLENNEMIAKQLSVTDFTQGEINMRLRKIDNAILRPVPSLRMKTAYIFYKGAEDTSGSPDAVDRKKGGFEAKSDAKQINWIITPTNVPIAISKTDKLRVFDPNTNQSHDGWKIDYRKYHDLWIKDNQLSAVIVNTQ
ncbi:MAG: hypothetical protein J1G06_04535 [Oscillospiraceae bacterium]|nr:hypothetical protein [Oscillospiraceae bacterium]